MGTLVPGENGHIVGIQTEDGVDYFRQHEADETKESWLSNVYVNQK